MILECWEERMNFKRLDFLLLYRDKFVQMAYHFHAKTYIKYAKTRGKDKTVTRNKETEYYRNLVQSF